MNFIRVDLYEDSMSIICFAEKGVVFVKERIPTKCIGKIEEFFSKQDIKPSIVACEAIEFYSLISNKVASRRILN